MATKAQIEKFIKEIAPIAIKAYNTLGKVYPSICIGMACVESAYGTAGSCTRNSFLGQKVGTGKTATKYWSGKFFTSKTKEEYKVGVHTTITSAFRSYDSMEQCVFNYYELLNTSLYKRVVADADYATQMQQIKACGYMTSSTEVNSVLNIIKKYNLTQYDNGSKIVSTISTSTTSQTTYPTLKYGSSNEYVKHVQMYLASCGYQVGKIDSKYGAITALCVRQYQIDYNASHPNKIAVDGIWGQQCWLSVGK